MKPLSRSGRTQLRADPPTAPTTVALAPDGARTPPSASALSTVGAIVPPCYLPPAARQPRISRQPRIPRQPRISRQPSISHQPSISRQPWSHLHPAAGPPHPADGARAARQARSSGGASTRPRGATRSAGSARATRSGPRPAPPHFRRSSLRRSFHSAASTALLGGAPTAHGAALRRARRIAAGAGERNSRPFSQPDGPRPLLPPRVLRHNLLLGLLLPRAGFQWFKGCVRLSMIQSTNVAVNRQMWLSIDKCGQWLRGRGRPGPGSATQLPRGVARDVCHRVRVGANHPPKLPSSLFAGAPTRPGPICRHRTSEAPCLTDFSTSGAPGLRRRLSDPRVGACRLHAARRPHDLPGASPLVFVRTMRCVQSAAPAVQLKTKLTPLSDAPTLPHSLRPVRCLTARPKPTPCGIRRTAARGLRPARAPRPGPRLAAQLLTCARTLWRSFWLLDCAVRCRNSVGWSRRSAPCHARSLDGEPPDPVSSLALLLPAKHLSAAKSYELHIRS